MSVLQTISKIGFGIVCQRALFFYLDPGSEQFDSAIAHCHCGWYPGNL